MIDVVQYRPEHLFLLRPQPAQQSVLASITPAHAEALAKTPAATVLHEDDVLLCGGVVPIWSGRAMVWAYVSADAGPHMLPVTRATQRFIEEYAVPRMELYVEEEFENGHRWAYMLGFQIESPLALRFFPDGSAASIYVRLT